MKTVDGESEVKYYNGVG